MKIHFLCPKCDQTAGVAFEQDTRELRCGHCDHVIPVPENAIHGSHVERCLVCPSDELFVRKDFPQKLGLGIIVAGFALSSGRATRALRKMARRWGLCAKGSLLRRLGIGSDRASEQHIKGVRRLCVHSTFEF